MFKVPEVQTSGKVILAFGSYFLTLQWNGTRERVHLRMWYSAGQ
jgi:hypothetical protein